MILFHNKTVNKKGCEVDVFICAFAFLDLCMQDSFNGLFNSIIKEEKCTCEIIE